MSLFSERLLTRRNRLGMTQDDLAEKSGVSKRSISDYEREESEPALDQLRKLAKALDISADWLLGDNTYPEHKPRNALMHELDSGQKEIVTTTLDTLHSQARAMVSQIDLLKRQVTATPSSATHPSEAQKIGKAIGAADDEKHRPK